MMKLLDATENWLYEEGDDEKKHIYVTKYTELKVSRMYLGGKQTW